MACKTLDFVKENKPALCDKKPRLVLHIPRAAGKTHLEKDAKNLRHHHLRNLNKCNCRRYKKQNEDRTNQMFRSSKPKNTVIPQKGLQRLLQTAISEAKRRCLFLKDLVCESLILSPLIFVELGQHISPALNPETSCAPFLPAKHRED